MRDDLELCRNDRCGDRAVGSVDGRVRRGRRRWRFT